MSRLESFIRRMSAQRVLLDHAADLVRGVPGPILELGLGAGRTYDHLRERLPDKEIFVFDTHLMGDPDLIPDRHHMILGDIRETLGFCLPRIGEPAALMHNDIGSGDDIHNAATRAWLAPLIPPLMAVGGVVVTSFTLDLPGFEKLPTPEGVPENRYHFYRRTMD